MKRDPVNIRKLMEKANHDPLLAKQISQLIALPDKEQGAQAVRLGRMHGYYFSERDWLTSREEHAKAA